MRAAESGDAGAVKAIWKECFHDDDAYIDLFLNKCRGFEKCLLCEADGVPVSMLHLLPQLLQLDGRRRKAQYVFAAATLSPYRKKGRMGELLQAASIEARRTGCDFTILMPASSTLYDFYHKFGFRTAFSIKSATFTRQNLQRLTVGGQVLCPGEYDSLKMDALRAEIFRSAVLWGPNASDYVSAEWRYGGGQILVFNRGFVFYIRKGDRVCVKEFCAEGNLQKDMLATLLAVDDSGRFEFSLYPGETFFRTGRVRQAGMIRPETEEGTRFLSGAGEIYINMMLD